MIFDTKRAQQLLVESGITAIPTKMMATNSDEFDEMVFKALSNARFNDNYSPSSDKIRDEICDWADNVKFEWKDVNFCVVVDEGDRMLHVFLRADSSWDQHMEIVDEPDYLDSCMEQAYEIDEGITTEQVISDLTERCATYDKSLEKYFC
jgi:hypothetical protein